MIIDARVCASQLCLIMESDHTDCGLAGESSLHNEADECIFGDMESYVYMFVCMYLPTAKTKKSCFRFVSFKSAVANATTADEVSAHLSLLTFEPVVPLSRDARSVQS